MCLTALFYFLIMQIQRCLTLSADAASDQACRRRYIVFQQDSDSPSYRAKDTSKLLLRKKPDFIAGHQTVQT